MAGQLRDAVEVEAARKEYELAWHEWAEILNDNPSLMKQLMYDDLLEDVQAYIDLLGHLEEKLPADFELLPLLKIHGALPGESLMTEEPRGPTPASNAAGNDDGKKPACRTRRRRISRQEERCHAGRRRKEARRRRWQTGRWRTGRWRTGRWREGRSVGLGTDAPPPTADDAERSQG